MTKKYPHTPKNAGFTLIEVLVSVVLSGIILTSAFAGFQGILKSQVRLSGVISIQRNLFYLNEKLASLIHSGGTIDYEEYFNRRVLGYDKSFNDGEWIYTTTSNYGNGESSGRPQLYLCEKDSTPNGLEDICLESNSVSIFPNQTPFTGSIYGHQMAYGQYREIGYNYKSLSGYPTPMRLPPIFPPDSTTTKFQTEGISDLYLIKKLPDGSYERTYFRHIYIQDPSTPVTLIACDPDINNNGCLGKIQMTKLIGCDNLKKDSLGNDIIGEDGIMDAWIPHPDFATVNTPCSSVVTTSISTAANNLSWVDVSSPEMNVIRAQFLPSPLKIPGKMAGVGEEALSPIVQIHLEVQLSKRVLTRGLLQEGENTPRFLTTTFDLDNN